ncbi:MAG: branched-chain amino acid transport system permease protein [Pseudonocardiales bacterium]|nr:branched-chain amino acid transport system permease protein [Pseudonocardiales bacterium]
MTLLRHLAVATVAGILLALFSLAVTPFANLQLASMAVFFVAVAGLTVLTGLNGQVSLGHGAFMAIGAYTTALLLLHLNWPFYLVLIISGALSAAVGAVVGAAAARLHGPYLAGATLALGVALPSITSHYTSVFKGDQGLFVTFAGPPASFGANFALERWQAWISLGAALIVLLLLANLARSAVGRNLRAVRDDEIAAQLAGLSVARVRVLAFSVSSAAAGLGGGVFAVVLQNASPGSFDLTLSLTLLSAVVIGGLGSLTGAVWGSIVVVYLGIVLRGWVDRLHLSAASTQRLHDNLPNGVYGLLLVVMMLALPGGIQSLVRRVGALVPRRSVPPTGGQE